MPTHTTVTHTFSTSALWARPSDESNVVVNAPTLEYDKLTN